MSNHMFFKIASVSESDRVVKGIMCTEEPDRVKEILDYEGSKPYIQEWSNEIFKSTNGQSFGNVRAMHGKAAIGKLTEPLMFDDDAKQITISAYIQDDNEWAKVEAGMYCGFSVGGNYVEKWRDGEFTRYTAKPVEVSIVDLPQMPSAKFAFAKMSGVIEEREFVHGLSTGGEVTNIEESNKVITNDQVAARAQELAKAAGKEGFAEFIEVARVELEKAAEGKKVDDPAEEGEDDAKKVTDKQKADAAALEGNDDNEAVKAAAADPRTLVKQVWITTDEKTFEKKADAIAHTEMLNDPVAKAAHDAMTAARSVLTDKPKSANAFTKGDYAYTPSDDKTTWRLRLTKSAGGEVDLNLLKASAAAITTGFMGKRVTIPVEDRAAVVTTLKAAFEKAAISVPACLMDETELAKFAAATMEKGVYDVSSFASIMQSVVNLRDCATYEAAMEGDNSPVPMKLTELLEQMQPLLASWLSEEVNEMLGKPQMFDADGVGTPMTKAADGDLAKAGARNSKADQNKLQEMHDHSVALGATCTGAEKVASGEDMQKMADANSRLEKMVVAQTDLLKEMTERLVRIEDQPVGVMPARADMSGLSSVSKAADAGNGDMTLDRAQELLKNATPDQLAMAAIRLSHNTGGVRVATRS